MVVIFLDSVLLVIWTPSCQDPLNPQTRLESPDPGAVRAHHGLRIFVGMVKRWLN